MNTNIHSNFLALDVSYRSIEALSTIVPVIERKDRDQRQLEPGGRKLLVEGQPAEALLHRAREPDGQAS